MSRSPQAPRNPTNPTAKRNPPCRVQRGDTRLATETKTLWRWRKTCTQQQKGSNNLSHKRRCESRWPIFFSRKHEAHDNNRPGLAGCRHEVNVQGCNDKGRRIIYIHYPNACKHLNFWAFFFFFVCLSLNTHFRSREITSAASKNNIWARRRKYKQVS